MNWLAKKKLPLGLVIANAGVAVSVLVGVVQFMATYEQTQADVAFLHESFDQMARSGDIESIRYDLDEATRELADQVNRATENATFVGERVTVLETQRDGTRARDHILDDAQREIETIRERLAALDVALQRGDEDRWKLDDLDSRLDRLDDFVIRWDEQSNMIMSEHEQFSEIIKEVWEAIDARGTVPAGAKREYGY